MSVCEQEREEKKEKVFCEAHVMGILPAAKSMRGRGRGRERKSKRPDGV